MNTGSGTSSWTGLTNVENGDRLIYNAHTSQWDRYAPPPVTGAVKPGDPVSVLVNDVGYLTLADLPPSASTLQEVLDNGNTSTTGLAIGTGGEVVQLTSAGGVIAAFGTSAAQKGNVMPRDDWSSIPART
jgi:hypothetical protein